MQCIPISRWSISRREDDWRSCTEAFGGLAFEADEMQPHHSILLTVRVQSGQNPVRG